MAAFRSALAHAASAPDREPWLHPLVGLSHAIASGEAAASILKRCVHIAVDLVQGSHGAIIVTTDQLSAVVQLDPDATLRPSYDLGPRAQLVCQGPLVSEVRGWAGTTNAVLSADEKMLIIPGADTGFIIFEPDPICGTDDQTVGLLQILANLAAGAIHAASKLQQAQSHTVALAETRRKLHEQNALLRELAVVDELTGLHNRRFFDRRLAYEIERFSRYHHPMGLILFDVDHFKRINDTYGHPAGDEVLKHLAQVGLQVLRRVDVLCRYGGEEFAVLMPDTDLTGSIACAERIRYAINHRPVTAGDHAIAVSISAGVAAYTDQFQDADAESLVRIADQALYQAKEGGRNRVVSGGGK